MSFRRLLSPFSLSSFPFFSSPKMTDQKKIREAINEILEGADLNTVTAKKVRLDVEKKLDIDLEDRKKEIDALVMEIVDEKNGGNEEESEEESEEEKPVKKRRAAKKESDDEDSEKGSEDEYKPAKKAAKKRKAAGDDDDWGKKGTKRAPAKKAAGGTGAKKGGGGFTKICKLSTELAEVMGEPSMARHEVVKRMWKIIKEKNLYDPKNKQFAICNQELLRVFGVKRFRTFGMMKYLKKHIDVE